MLLALIHSACGGDSGKTGTDRGGSGSGTNMAGVLITPERGEIRDENGDVVADGPEWLLLLSSHYDVYSVNPLWMQWTGLVKNIGSEIVCPTLNPKFYDDQGAELLSFIGGQVYAPLYARPGEDIPRMCVRPGALAMAAAYDFSNQPVELERVAEVGYSATGSTYSNLSPREWIALSAVSLENNAVSGTVVTGENELRSWSVSVFGTVQSDVGQVPLGLQFASKGELGATIPAGDVETFDAPPFHAAVTDFQVFPSVMLP